MTLRELLSCWESRKVLRLVAYDHSMDTKYIKVYFAYPEDYEDELEELDCIADCRIQKWYHQSDRLIVVLDTDF